MKTIDVFVVTDMLSSNIIGVFTNEEEALNNSDEYDKVDQFTLELPVQVQRDY